MGLNRRKFFGSLGGLVIAPLFVPTPTKSSPIKVNSLGETRGERIINTIRKFSSKDCYWELSSRDYDEVVKYFVRNLWLINTCPAERNRLHANRGIYVHGIRVYANINSTYYITKIERNHLKTIPAAKYTMQSFSI